MKMTEPQRLRFAALSLANSKGSLSAPEAQELAFLTKLATETGELEDLQVDTLLAAHTEAGDGDDADGDDADRDDADRDDADGDDADRDDADGDDADRDDADRDDADGDDADGDDKSAGFLSNAKSMFKGNAKLNQANQVLRRENGDLKAKFATAEKAGTDQAAQLKKLTAERTELSTALDTAKADTKTVYQSVTDELSLVGQPEDKLPGSASTDKPEQPANEDELRTALKDCDDEPARIKLVREYDRLQEASAENELAYLN